MNVLLASVTGIEFQNFGVMDENDLSSTFLFVVGKLREIWLDERKFVSRFVDMEQFSYELWGLILKRFEDKG